MTTPIRVYSLASDDDSGTRAQVFTTELAAVSALLDHLEIAGPVRDELLEIYFSPDIHPDKDFYDWLRPHKSDLDVYSIDSHDLAIELPIP